MGYIKNLPVTAKLLLGFGLLLVQALLITAAGLFGLHTTQESMIRLKVYGGMYDATVAARDANFSYALDQSREHFKAHDEAVSSIEESLRTMVAEIDSGGRWSKADQDWVLALTADLQRYVKDHQAALNQSSTGAAAGQIQPLNERLATLQTDINAHYTTEEGRLQGAISTSNWQLIGTWLLSLVFGLGMALLISRQIVRPLQEALQIGRQLANGDLTIHPHSAHSDEPGQLINVLATVVANLHQMIDKIRISTEQILSAAAEIVAGSTHLSQRTEQQAAAVEETASTMAQLSATIHKTADNTAQTHDLTSRAEGAVQHNGTMMEAVTQCMQGINRSSEKMSEIIGVIELIAFQTNILALNAAVEAARAGEQGKGFAVVAGEVRSLAQKSATAAKEIKELIGTSVGQIQEGGQLVERANTAMQGVVQDVGNIRTLMAEIAKASQEQSTGISQTNQVVAQIDISTQQNAALAEQSSAAAGTLEEQAAALSHAVGAFRLKALAG
ncbi:MAG: hypothetical protein K2X65_05450 [Burkholderiaceae bacterium]|jgi:methyl-accepting chemotaxis protein-2 (aspartate sensor receptor)|nr:hypothetical protein [Burkholderiaceae bacterium]